MQERSSGGLSTSVRQLRAALADVAAALSAAGADDALDVGVAARQVHGAAVVVEQIALLRLLEVHPDPPTGPRRDTDRMGDVVAEVAAAAGVSWGSARARYSRAQDLAAVPALRAALLAGEVDWTLVLAFLDRTAALSPQDRVEVADRLLARHRATPDGLTAVQWSRLLGRTVLAVDPAAGERRVRYARAQRTGWHRLVDDATGMIGLRGPIADTMRAWAEIDAAARAAAADPDETRTLDQLRFDLGRDRLLALGFEIVDLVDLVDHRENREPDVAAEPPPHASPDEAPEASAGTGGPDSARRGQTAEDTEDTEDDQEAEPGPPRGRSGSRGGDTVTLGGRVCTVLNITIPLTTLIGLDDAPGEIAGSGPIGADAARAFAAAASIWRRLLTDPVDGHLVIQDLKTYRPSDAQRRFVLARHDWASAARGGETTRTGVQLDHDIPYAAGGATSVLNLPPLDERSHDRKTKKRWRHRYDGTTGTLTQTTTLGRTYRTTPLPPVGPTGTRAGPDTDDPPEPGGAAEDRWELPPLREPPAWLDEPSLGPDDEDTA